mmetsp:Transcript_16260/g.38740  ORF Transcript_16260/g.38740 Transcript_16260/m.38740 type:complete len:215 (+) Transcript_16260:585-1229(+)
MLHCTVGILGIAVLHKAKPLADTGSVLLNLGKFDLAERSENGGEVLLRDVVVQRPNEQAHRLCHSIIRSLGGQLCGSVLLCLGGLNQHGETHEKLSRQRKGLDDVLLFAHLDVANSFGSSRLLIFNEPHVRTHAGLGEKFPHIALVSLHVNLANKHRPQVTIVLLELLLAKLFGLFERVVGGSLPSSGAPITVPVAAVAAVTTIASITTTAWGA